MKTFEYTPDELNAVVYQVQSAEKSWQGAKDTYEILYESSKDLLASIMNDLRLSIEGKVSSTELEEKARSSKEWKQFRHGLFEAQRALGTASLGYNHSKRVLDAMTSGLAFKRELLKRGIVDQ